MPNTRFAGFERNLQPAAQLLVIDSEPEYIPTLDGVPLYGRRAPTGHRRGKQSNPPQLQPEPDLPVPSSTGDPIDPDSEEPRSSSEENRQTPLSVKRKLEPVESISSKKPRNGQSPVSRSLCVGQLPVTMDDFGLHELFVEYGVLSQAYIRREAITGHRRRFGFVQFTEIDCAQRALMGMQGMVLDGCALNVNYDKSGVSLSSSSRTTPATVDAVPSERLSAMTPGSIKCHPRTGSTAYKPHGSGHRVIRPATSSKPATLASGEALRRVGGATAVIASGATARRHKPVLSGRVARRTTITSTPALISRAQLFQPATRDDTAAAVNARRTFTTNGDHDNPEVAVSSSRRTSEGAADILRSERLSAVTPRAIKLHPHTEPTGYKPVSSSHLLPRPTTSSRPATCTPEETFEPTAGMNPQPTTGTNLQPVTGTTLQPTTGTDLQPTGETNTTTILNTTTRRYQPGPSRPLATTDTIPFTAALIGPVKLFRPATGNSPAPVLHAAGPSSTKNPPAKEWNPVATKPRGSTNNLDLELESLKWALRNAIDEIKALRDDNSCCKVASARLVGRLERRNATIERLEEELHRRGREMRKIRDLEAWRRERVEGNARELANLYDEGRRR